jgi:hypothetical protein
MEAVPPKLYGGTERVVSHLAEELVRQGHEVTLFASGDSHTQAELVPCAPTALRLDPNVRDWLPHYAVMLDEVRRQAGRFDVLHFHIDIMHFPIFRPLAASTVTTLQGRQDLPDLPALYRAFPEMPLVSISYAQREPLPDLNWVGNVHHGLPLRLHPFAPGAENGYLAFLGRISPEKAAGSCDRYCRARGHPLEDRRQSRCSRPRILRHTHPTIARSSAGRVHRRDRRVREELISRRRSCAPLPNRLAGALRAGCDRSNGLRHAGHRGAVPEVIDHGLTGFIVDTVDDAVTAVERAGTLDRTGVRATFERRFSAERMTQDYLGIYGALARERKPRPAKMNVAA